ncbi:SDR family oxidoreductase [Pseudoruegeria sp. SK021]|uniref:SDR family NAD(P)-dependent oxidoreductase n=1 Tax=Pseudoruegeria sp. SK021 TaxID=1933035 RepID=UPI000A229342|nr:SDR family NAD(P)-dependent oxidoreductase [Pseudoruegeria sp. SK021]OSP55084.1 short-chain dehydrogenase [Pseudoruegeria sp. SK021]
MTDWTGKRYWVIGASHGLGRALSVALNRAGAELIVSARSAEALMALADDMPGPVQVLPLDVTDQAAVDAAAEQIGAIDGMIYLAGIYWPMAAQNWHTDRVVAMTEVNYLGAVRTVGAVLPGMLARGAGHIVLTGSLSGFRGLSGAIGYASGKAALMGLGESLQADLHATGVRVQIANPGFIRTRLTDKNDFTMPFIMDADPAAAAMMRGISGGRRSFNFPWLFSLVFRLSRFLPDGLYIRLFGAKN